jgi:hypothetical protein
MRKKIALLCFLILPACRTPRPVYTQEETPPPQKEINALYSALARELILVDVRMDYDTTSRAIAPTKIIFVNGEIPCNVPERNRCRGVYRPHTDTILVDYIPGQCLSDTALAHEMIHALLTKIRLHGDGTHTQREYWDDALRPALLSYCRSNCRGFCR